MEEKTEGILLQSTPFLGSQRILKVMTLDQGLLSLIAKKKETAPLTTPFCRAEWVFKKGKEEIHTLKDGTMLDDLSQLKQNYATLSAAGQMAHDCLQTQLPGKKEPLVYQLLLAYLKKLTEFEMPQILNASFRLKLLICEGILSLNSICNHCEKAALCLSGGESVCPSHAAHRAIFFRQQEWNQIMILGVARRFSQMQEENYEETLFRKIDSLFSESALSQSGPKN